MDYNQIHAYRIFQNQYLDHKLQELLMIVTILMLHH